MRLLLAALLLALAVVPATAGEDCGTCPLGGFSCDNACPLAQQVNLHRATGTEALLVAPRVRQAWVAVVARNLEKI